MLADWEAKLDFFKDGSFDKVMSRVRERAETGVEILPPQQDILKVFEILSPNDVRVVILGQDPYPTPGHAHGLSFSVQEHVRPLPRSLNNIFKELHADLGIEPAENGNLERWVEQGVLLLNTTLTVEAGNAGAHAKFGWAELTDQVICHLSDQYKNIVFILWGGHARKKSDLIDRDNHLVIETAHPSPLSARRGFFGSKPFSRTNEYLKEQAFAPIEW